MKKLTLFLSLFTLLLLPASQTIDAQELGQKVYWMATIEVPVGQLSAYHAFAEKELIPPPGEARLSHHRHLADDRGGH